MKSLAAVLAFVFPLAAQGGVTSATLFPSHAQLVWEEPVALEQGAGRVTLTGLPVGLQDRTLVAGFEGLRGVTIQQVNVRQVEETEVVAAETRRLQQQLDEVETRIGRQEDEISAWNQQVTLMTEAAAKPGEVTAAELTQLADTVQSTTHDALSRIREIRGAMAGDMAERDRIQRELAATRQNARASKNVTIDYSAERSGQGKARLEYQIRDAGWKSRYNARLTTVAEGDGASEGNLVLEHLAVIRQNTGIDWPNVRLALSTANAHLGTDIPPLSPWIVTPGDNLRNRGKMALESTMDSIRIEAGSAPQAAIVQNEGSFTQSYRIPAPVSVDSGPAEQIVTVATYPIPVTLETRLFPAMDTNGFLHATGTFRADVSLPQGTATLYRDGQSIGSTHLERLEPDSNLSLGFGVNEKVSTEVIREQNQKG